MVQMLLARDAARQRSQFPPDHTEDETHRLGLVGSSEPSAPDCA